MGQDREIEEELNRSAQRPAMEVWKSESLEDWEYREMLDGLPVWATVDLDAIAHNVAAIKQHVGNRVSVMAVVKANAYGHGAELVASMVLESGASWLAVNRVGEGVALRRSGIRAPILVMGYTPTAGAMAGLAHDLTLTVTSAPQAEAISTAASRMNKSASVHVKIDTGMGRFGLLPHEVQGFVKELRRLPDLKLEGMFTHFAVADLVDKTYTLRQFAIYLETLAALEMEGIHIPMRHVANSAATLDLPATHLDAVRPGIAVYGLRPSSELEPAIALCPALTLKSRVGRVRTLPAGSSISYGRTFVTEHPSRMALVPIGYGDGYLRLNSNRGAVLVHGQRAPIRGRVCMDQLVVEISDIQGVHPDDEVVLIGRQGDEVLSAEEVAAWGKTINYEVVTQLMPRVPRVYLSGGKIVSIVRQEEG
jgi:alanine racemase